MAICPLLSSQPARAVPRVGFVLGLFALSACGAQPQQHAVGGSLYARGLDEISDLYLEPVTSARLAMAGAARLARLDNDIKVSDTLGSGAGGALALSYNGRDIAMFAIPAKDDAKGWGEAINQIIATAKQASPKLAAAPQEAVDRAVFDGMTAALDHFSRYSPPEMARDQRAARDGYGGVGITLDSADNLYQVTAVSPQSPADRAGIKPDDRILAIDGFATSGRTHDEVIHQLRGPIGSTIRLAVQKPGSGGPRELHLQRAFVVVPRVTMARDRDIAVFRIASFNHSTTERVAEGLAEAQRAAGGHLAGVVLDLRGNPGGLLDQAVSLADLFIHDGPIVSTDGRNPASHQYFAAKGDAIAPHVPVAVLINGGSASASEIVAAAVQDHARGVVIGSSSYGKGTVQTVLRLPNDGELIVSWARLVTPAGYYLQRHGVVPTVCTAALGDDSAGLDRSLQLPMAQPRAALDDAAWTALRQSCPPRRTTPAIDLQLAERMFADPRLYAAALQALPAASRLAANPSMAAAVREPALTGGDRALSSRSR